MPEQHDPIDELARFGAGFNSTQGADMPHSPAAARRRGDQIRRRRTALVAGGAALAVTAVAVPIFTLTGGDPGRDVPVTDPNHTLAPMSEADLISEDQTVAERSADWKENFSGPAQTQAAFSVCAKPISELGTDRAFERNFVTSDDAGSAGETRLNETIAEFATPDRAEAAATELRRWYDECQPEGSADFDAEPWSTVDVGDGLSGETMVGTYTADSPRLLGVGIVVDGDRVAVLAQDVPGSGDQSGPGLTVEQMLPAVADRLAADEIDESQGSLSAKSLPTSDDAVFFSGSDWVERTTAHDQGEQANPCLTHPLADLGAVDTWRRDFRAQPAIGPAKKTFLVATVSDFASPEIAAEAYERIFADVDQCEFNVDAEPNTMDHRSVDLDDLGDAGQVVTTSWVDPYDPDAQNARIIVDTGVVRVGSRLLVVTQQYIGQELPIDGDHPDGTTADTLRNAAARLK